MCATMLLHVVFACEGLVAFWAEGILLTSVLLCVASSVSGCGEVIAAVVLLGERTRIAVFLGTSIGRC